MTITKEQAERLKDLIEDNKDKALKMLQSQEALWRAEKALHLHIQEMMEKQ
jgi:hypothetical protein